MLEEGISSVATCYNGEKQVICNDQISPGYIAKIECAFGYVKPIGRGFNSELRCNADGQWSNYKQNCEMECGKLSSDDVTAFSIGGKSVNITKTPWHVGIYVSFGEDSNYKYQCGGTIISSNVVLSAAHCFWDESSMSTYSESLFTVVAGKYYRDYNSNEEYFQPQKVNIKEIHIDVR